MGRLRSPQRQLEVDLMRFCFNKLGLPVRGDRFSRFVFLVL